MSEWGPWIEHDGMGCPLPVGTLCRVAMEGAPGDVKQTDTVIKPMNLWGWDWMNYGLPIQMIDGRQGLCGRVLRYRVHKPDAITLLERIAADPQPIPGEHVPA